jgi:uncharacterized protein
MIDATLLRAIAGGALIGVSASLLLLGLGRIAGISGIVAGVFLPTRGDVGWRALFLLGLVLAGAVALLVAPEHIGTSPRPLIALALGGLLVGVGTRLGSGCTSGHGVCGISRLSQRSLVATATFMLAAIATTAVLRWLAGASWGLP